MGVVVLILGESGSGKSYSLKNLDPNTVGVFNVSNKPLPFKNGKNFRQYKGAAASYGNIYKAFSNPTLKRYVIDDANYLMTFEEFGRSKETGYAKFTEMATHFYSMVQAAIAMPDDVITYFMMHVESGEDGKIRAKTTGKMISDKLVLEGLFSIVLLTQVDGSDRRHYFVTQTDGYTTAKSPEEMFDIEIPNDLNFVDKTIREYYGLAEV